MTANSDSSYDVVAVLSHRRSGTHLTIDTVRQNIVGLSNRFFTLETILPSHHEPCPLEVFKSRVVANPGCVVKAHVLPNLSEFYDFAPLFMYASNLLARAKILYAVRDGRDVMVSLYEYRRKLDEDVAGLSFSEFLRRPSVEGKNPARYWAEHVESWAREPGVLIVPYESYHIDYAGVVCRIADFLGRTQRNPIFDMVMSRNPEAARMSSAVQFRRGGMGDHSKYFSSEDLSFFADEAKGAMRIHGEALRDFAVRSDG